MDHPLRVLLVEDSDVDAKLVLRELKRGGFEVEAERVETQEQMSAALERVTWDVVLCDYNMPILTACRPSTCCGRSGTPSSCRS